MDILLNITNEQNKIEITDELQKLIEKVIKKTLEIHNIRLKTEISVLFTNDEEIQKINKEYRDTDKSTDVLSFPQLEFEKEGEIDEFYYPKKGEYPYLMLGDIIISVEHVFRQAEEFGHSREREIGYLTAHSMLHLLGYDHMEDNEKSRMREKEEIIMKEFNLKRN